MAGTISINDVFAVTETQKITASDGEEGDEFGGSVSISGDTAIVGGDDAAYIFTRSGDDGVWSEQAKLTASDGAEFDDFGESVSISGDTAIVGAHYDDDACPLDPGCNSGSAYIFTRSGDDGVWSEQKLAASDAAEGDRFGFSVSISSDTAIVGAIGDDSAYIFTRSGEVWTEQAKLIASDAAENYQFGVSVSISGDTAIVGAQDDPHAGGGSGSAYIFTRSGEVWTEQAKLIASDAADDDEFGASVSISDDTVIIGAAFNDNNNISNFGAAYIFTRSSDGIWSEQKLTASEGAENNTFGGSVSISGDTVIVGGNRDDSADIFTRSGDDGVWSEQAKLIASDAAAFYRFGSSVFISGDTAIVGGDDAAYIFEISTNNPPTASNDDVETLRNISVEIDVLVNDTDIDNDTLSIDSIGTPSNGMATFTSYKISYIPDSDFVGPDSFGYTISDGNGGFATATATVNVITTQEGIANLQDDVDALGLSQGPLKNILKQLNDNNPKNDQAACGKISGFINKIGGFVASGDITAAEGQALIDAAKDIKTSLGIC